MSLKVIFSCLGIFILGLPTQLAVASPVAPIFPGIEPGLPLIELVGPRIVLRNQVLESCWVCRPEELGLVEFVDRLGGQKFSTTTAPILLSLPASDSEAALQLRATPNGVPDIKRLAANPKAQRIADRFAGYRVVIPIKFVPIETGKDAPNLEGHLELELREQSNYIRAFLTIEQMPDGVDKAEVELIRLPVENAQLLGEVQGSPLIAGTAFAACEHPMATNRVEEGHWVCCGPWYRSPGSAALRRSAVIGVAPPHQWRRAFLYYVERERARPYQLFLNYNSWWDIAWGDRKMNEGQCLEVIRIFGEELTQARGVTIDAFVFDDGWDDNRTLWEFHEGFPRGFAPVVAEARRYRSGIGTWLSPWGGYGQAKKERLAHAKIEGFETNRNGFSLAGPKYFQRFRDICLRVIREYDNRYFKFDGIGESYMASGVAAEFAPDVEALLALTDQLRESKPDIFLSITTGTWPSPFWLFYGDSIWRSGDDWATHGVGSKRQQWITYRDMIVHRRIAKRAPLYPLNSLMTVTVCFGQLGTSLEMGRELPDLLDEIHMAFASGTQNLELYVTGHLLEPAAWDALAKMAQWARENREVLVDIHWMGGDPGNGEVYGYGAWSPQKAIVSLRNPADVEQSFQLEIGSALELPENAADNWRMIPVVRRSGRSVPETVTRGQPLSLQLAPCEVLVFELVPNSP